MNEQLFREKPKQNVVSPDQLNDYIHVTNPGVWMTLLAIIVLLVGVCVWGIYGTLDTKLQVAVYSENGVAYCYVKEENIDSVKVGMKVDIDGNTYSVAEIPSEPVPVENDEYSSYIQHLGNFQEDEWIYEVRLDGTLETGAYQGDLITDRVSPLSFVFN